MDPGEGMSPCFQGLALQDCDCLTCVGKEGESLLPCPAFSLCQFSGRWYVLSLRCWSHHRCSSRYLAGDFRNRKGLPAQGSLHPQVSGHGVRGKV